MPRQLLAKAGLHHRRILYRAMGALTLALLGAALLLFKESVGHYHERQVSRFSADKEEIQRSVDKFSARLLQFADTYEGAWNLRNNDSVPAQRYAAELSRSGGVMVTSTDATVTPFTLISQLVDTRERARLTMSLRALRDVSVLSSIDANKVGLTLHSYLYSPDAGFFASSPPLPEELMARIRREDSRLYVHRRIGMAESIMAGMTEKMVREQRPIWRPADGRDDRGLASRVVVPLYRNSQRILTLSLVLPDRQLSQSLLKSSARRSGFFLFSQDGRRNLGNASLSKEQQYLLRHIHRDRERLVRAHGWSAMHYSNGIFIISQRVAGPEWIAVYAYGWRDIINSLQGDLIIGSLFVALVLISMWICVVYVDRRMTKSLLDSAESLIEAHNFGKAIVDILPIGVGVYAPGSNEVVLENSVARRMLALGEGDNGIFFYMHVTSVLDTDSSEGRPLVEVSWDVCGGESSCFGVASSTASLEGRGVTIICMVDMSQQKASENVLIEARRNADDANRAKSMFLAIASHEIRTPLHGAMGCLELLSIGSLDNQQREWVMMIRRSFDSLLGLVNDLLDQAKLEANALQISPVAMSPNDIVENCARSLAAAITQAGVQFYCITDPLLDVTIEGDAQRLGQVLQNLLGNASKFTERGVITIASRFVRQDGDLIWVRFEVSDTGIGIPVAMQAAIFDPLTQVDDSVSRRYGGTGLGLFLCRKLSQLMGGEVTVHSEPGVGSLFTVELPFKCIPGGEVSNNGMPLNGLSVQVCCAIPAWGDALTDRLKYWGALVKVCDVSSKEPVDLRVLAEVDAPEMGAAPFGTVKLGVHGPLSPHRSERFVEVTSLSRESFLQALLTLIGREIDVGSGEEPRDELNQDFQMAILVAEDDPVNRVLIEHQLAALGCHDVRVAVDGQEALKLWRERRADLVITDLGMPHLDGVELFRILGQFEPEPFVVATSASVAAEMQAGLECFPDQLQKPVQLSDLRRILCLAEMRKKSKFSSESNDIFVPELDALMRKTFLAGWEEERVKIEEALDVLNWSVLRRHLHRLQGALMALGFDGLASHADRLQHLHPDRDWTMFVTSCSKLLDDVGKQVGEHEL
ncbi:ATP-binding protein [Xanthomonas citri pv. glycines]|uniref:histidine kinase n=1 Tax=Xanthomonas campestris pv. glycines TaxID=473421 RepID=A0AAX0HY02_XANCG|nr:MULTISPECIES: hybrid sensor histidine kinase/response regulator [Xanthomonas]AOY61943.1 sensor histidine kinase [Xanthomonas citri pv. glycines str. 8ra]ARV24389.1 hypothetical protein A9D66_17755 [Xanthomonas citri pv. glycines str. 12-2]OEY89500.1 hypothetical protein BIY41_16940 [Xanthomonas citri pv. glycines]QDR46436.1 response regulator [Xanthomonas citri pv. glycines]QDS21427.1 response regulator [Xanthomonas citri pv. glycines]